MTDTNSFEQRMQRVEALIGQIEASSDPAVQDAAREMVRALLDLHAAGLSKLLKLLSGAGDQGRCLIDACMADDLVRSLLLLHDLHPDAVETRVQQALAKARPYLNSHGGDVELLSLDEGKVRLRMQGSCNGCPSSSATLKGVIEGAILEAAPDVTEIDVEGLPNDPAASGPTPDDLVQLEITAGQ